MHEALIFQLWDLLNPHAVKKVHCKKFVLNFVQINFFKLNNLLTFAVVIKPIVSFKAQRKLFSVKDL